jgi:hypothetical protein
MLKNQDILNFGPIGDWVSFEDSMTGTIVWSRKNDDFVVYATPHWSEDGIVPVEAVFSDGEGTTITEFSLSLNESVEYQLNQYIARISVIFSKLN